ncbi:MAG: hypothetical protein ALECFALPRED_002716, partial [Alectoria fallacina]
HPTKKTSPASVPMSNFLNSIILTTNTHPVILGLTVFTLAFFVSSTLIAASLTYLHDDYDCEDHLPIFISQETRPLLDGQDPFKDYPYGRSVTRTVSARRARMQSAKRAFLRRALKADWADSSYGTIAAGPRVGEKRRMRDEGVGRGKRVRIEESSEDDGEW